MRWVDIGMVGKPTHQNTDAADNHGASERSPVLVPGFASYSILNPDLRFVLVHSPEETDIER